MNYNDRYAFCEKTAEYVEQVTLHLAEKVGDQAAFKRVVERLSIVLENMFDEAPPEDVASSLIPKPHNFPMPR